jgi:AMMECR1 domain-containing protein
MHEDLISREVQLATPEVIPLQTDLAGLLPVARQHLHWLFGESAAVEADHFLDPPLPRVNVTLRCQGAVRGSMSGVGETLREQLLDAVYRSSRDTRFSGSIVKADLQNISLEVWLQTSAEPIPLGERGNSDVIQLGQDGVEVSRGSASAYYKPSVALTSQFETPQEMFSALCQKANLPADAWKEFSCALRRTSWVHFCETPDGSVVELYALRVNKPLPITKDVMVEWATQCVSYFINNQYSDGSFCYQYRPFKDTAKRKPTNPVRASGCAYAMAEAASSQHLESNPEAIECAAHAIEEILRRSTPLDTGGSYISDSQSRSPHGKLGTTALLLLALLTPAFRIRYAKEIEQLLTAIKNAQLSSGLLECTFGATQGTDSQINFFPGQALLALVLRAAQGDESCKAHYRRAFAPYREHFRKSPTTAFIGWQVDVWARAALLDENAEYADFAFEQVDWMLQYQVRGDQRQLTSGGFSWNGKPPYYSSIVYTEAIARAADLAYRLGDPRWPGYRAAFRAGLRFCSRLRLTEEQSVFFPHPRRAIGGMATTLSNFEVRSDVIQHSITLALAALNQPALLNASAGPAPW